jgi:hypothetical protein
MQASGARRSILLAALLVSACGPDDSAADTSGPGAEPVAEATISASPFPADYAAMREGARAWAADMVKPELDGRGLPGDTGYAPYFDTMSCAEPDAEAVEVSARDQQLAALAHEAVLLEARLQAYGYLPGVWQGPVAEWERASLAILSTSDVPRYEDPAYEGFEARLSALGDKLAVELEIARAREQPDALPIKREGGCGAAEAPVFVKADPPGGRIWVTTRFTFDVCKARKLDPWDREACRWAEMAPDREAWLSGNYMVQGEWPDGATTRTSRRIETDDPDNPGLVTIRPG